MSPCDRSTSPERNAPPLPRVLRATEIARALIAALGVSRYKGTDSRRCLGLAKTGSP